MEGTIYSKEYYDKAFEEIYNLSNSLSPEELCLEIAKRVDTTMIFANGVSKEALEKFELYRLRVPESSNFKENDFSCHYYPKDDVEILMGRANLQNQQVFYASADMHSPFHELASKIKIGETFAYIGVWGFRGLPEITYARNLFLGIPENEDSNIASLMASGLIEKIRHVFSEIPEEFRDNFIYAQKRFTELFTMPDRIYYRLSSAIANDTFVSAASQNLDIPILTYPSVAKDKKAVNFAIRKDFADKYLYLKKLYKVLVRELSIEIVKIEVFARADVNDKIIVWKQPTIKFEIIEYSISFIDESIPKRKLVGNEEFTRCCKYHTMDFSATLEYLGISDNKILKFAPPVASDLYNDVPLRCQQKLNIKVDNKLYLTSNISEFDRIVNIEILVNYNAYYR